MPRMLPSMSCKYLIERNTILILVIHGTGIRSRKELIRISMTVNSAHCRVGQAGENRHLIT